MTSVSLSSDGMIGVLPLLRKIMVLDSPAFSSATFSLLWKKEREMYQAARLSRGDPAECFSYNDPDTKEEKFRKEAIRVQLEQEALQQSSRLLWATMNRGFTPEAQVKYFLEEMKILHVMIMSAQKRSGLSYFVLASAAGLTCMESQVMATLHQHLEFSGWKRSSLMAEQTIITYQKAFDEAYADDDKAVEEAKVRLVVVRKPQNQEFHTRDIGQFFTSKPNNPELIKEPKDAVIYAPPQENARAYGVCTCDFPHPPQTFCRK